MDGIDQIVLSLSARGLPPREIAAHFEEVYGAKVSKDTNSNITEKVVGELAQMPQEVKRRYFELIREGLSGSEAAREVGVSVSCGSRWFIEAGSVTVNEQVPISSRYFSQDDRIEIADGLTAGISLSW